MVVGTRWTVDIGVNSLAVEHLTSDAGVPGSIPGPVTYFHLYFFAFCSFLPSLLVRDLRRIGNMSAM